MDLTGTMTVTDTCPDCKGDRWLPWISGYRMLCPLCGGDGVVLRAYQAVTRYLVLPARGEPGETGR